jgi:hypothetical protein
MALNPADIATVSRLLDEALGLAPAEREPWLAAHMKAPVIELERRLRRSR